MFWIGPKYGSVSKFGTSNRFRRVNSYGFFHECVFLLHMESCASNFRTFRHNKVSLNLYLAVDILPKDVNVQKEKVEKDDKTDSRRTKKKKMLV